MAPPFACRTCNRAKSDQTTPDPTQVLTAEHVQVHSDGSIDGLTAETERLIWLVDLDGVAPQEPLSRVDRTVDRQKSIRSGGRCLPYYSSTEELGQKN